MKPIGLTRIGEIAIEKGLVNKDQCLRPLQYRKLQESLF